jgi:hypothetical protein
MIWRTSDCVPGLAPLSQFCTIFCDNWDAEKIESSVAEAALGKQASGSWAWLSSVTAQSSAEKSLVGRDSGVWAWMSSGTAENADGGTESAVAATSRQALRNVVARGYGHAQVHPIG